MSHVTVLVEVEVATARPPRTHARIYTQLSIERRSRTNVQIEAEEIAYMMALSHPHVVMVTGIGIIDWDEP